MSRKTFLALTLFFLTASVVGQSGPPEMPHRVYGNITDQASSDPVEVNVSLRNGSTLASGSSSQNGFYDIRFTASEGNSVFLFVDDTNTSESVVYEAGSSQEINYAEDSFTDTLTQVPQKPEDGNDTEDNSTEEEDEEDTDTGSGGSSGGGGGGGSLPGFGEDNDTQDETDDQEDNSGGSLAPPSTKTIDVTLD